MSQNIPSFYNEKSESKAGLENVQSTYNKLAEKVPSFYNEQAQSKAAYNESLKKVPSFYNEKK